MIVAEVSTFTLGVYTVRARPRPDNPGFAVYLIFRGHSLIGKSFSIPDEGCCVWLETSKGVYAHTTHRARWSRNEGQRSGTYLSCEGCGTQIYRRPSETRKRFCGTKCRDGHMRKEMHEQEQD